MRADSFQRLKCLAGRSLCLFFVFVAISGCKTEQSAEDPVILGIPPEDAYLGVEYSYNFGAVDTDDILDYSLSNAPSWLALEDTSNKARQGIIMRGVPGITGGGRGRDDLGLTERINLVGTDRSAFDAQPFSIEVKENILTVVSADYTEGPPEVEEEAEEEKEEEKPDFECEPPVLEGTGEHSYTVNAYNDSGEVTGFEERTETTHPILVKVLLDQPSVTTVRVAFELRSNFDPNRCDDGFTPDHQRCDNGKANQDEAMVGKDVVGLGSNTTELPVPAYIDYQLDEDGFYTKGVLTFEPGITDCFVRLEITDDSEPEPTESFLFALTEVRSGIAALGPSNTNVLEPLRIKDNEPTVTFETLNGGKRDVVNVGAQTEYRATIQGDRAEMYSVKIAALEGSDAIIGSDFELEVDDGAGGWVPGDLLEFDVGVDERFFRVVVPTPDPTAADSPENDRFALLGVDPLYQQGRSNFAAGIEDDELRVSINELTTDLVVGNSTGFVPTDISVGQNGRIFLTGYDAGSGNVPLVVIFDQEGNEVSRIQLSTTGINLLAPPVVTAQGRDVVIANKDVTRFEFAVAFGVEESEPGVPSPGDVNVVTQRWFFDSAIEDYAQDWSLYTGTDQDDYPRWVGIDSNTGSVFLMGETLGPVEPDDQFNGTFGSYVRRIDTEEDGASLNPEVAWSRKVESSSHNEQVVGGGISNTNAIVIGDSSGSVEGQSQLGGLDAFFYSVSDGEQAIDRLSQVGTVADEDLTDGFFGTNVVWLVGNGTSKYRDATVGGVRTLQRSRVNSDLGFLLGYTPAGSIMETYSVNDVDDVSTETLTSGMVFDKDVVAAGFTDGVVAADPSGPANTASEPMLIRRNRMIERDENGNDLDNPSREWDRQFSLVDPATGSIEGLANYRDDEIVGLWREGDTWRIRLFSPEGVALNNP